MTSDPLLPSPSTNTREWKEQILQSMPEVIAKARAENTPFWEIDQLLSHMNCLKRELGHQK